MVQYFFQLFIVFIFIFISCDSGKDRALLSLIADITAMGDTTPKAAMQKLDSIRPLVTGKTGYVSNKFNLLDIRLRDKMYLTHTTDSVIKNISKYFEEYGSNKEKQEAYYYMGSVYRDLNDSPNAVKYFLKSKQLAENCSNIDSVLWEYACSQLSGLYISQLNYNEALNMSLQELQIAIKRNRDDVYSYMYVADCYWELRDTINTLKYTKLALKKINGKVNRNNADIIAKAMQIYALTGYKNEASQCFEILQSLQTNDLPYNYLICLAAYYRKCVSVDSAASVMSELYDRGKNIESKYDASRWLTRYYEYKGDYKNAAHYAIKFINANEELTKKISLEHTTKVNNVFQYRRNKEEELRIIQQAAEDRVWLLSGVLISLMIIFVIVFLYYYRKKQMLDNILCKENDIKDAKELILQKEMEIVKKRNELKKLVANNYELLAQLLKTENDSKKLIAQNCELTKLALMDNLSNEAGEIIDKCKKAAIGKYIFSDDEWRELLGAIDKIYPEFTYEVQAKFKRIKEPMLRVCYLVKIGLSNPEIVNITGYPPQTVWDRVKRAQSVLGL